MYSLAHAGSGIRAALWGQIALLLFVLAACSQPQLQPSAEQGLPLAPVQSPNDSNAYRYIELDNGLRALLISDPEAEKAAASLDVNVGSASNPGDRGGLAHFLEHMLFLGTDKYPDSSEYANFVAEHGGNRNAYTAFEHTNYFFDIDQAYLPEALDRFAQFFIAPRFDAEYVEREVNAVHAEFQMGLNTDARRNLDVMREVVNPEHPFSILGVGTSATLANHPDSPVRDELLAFYRQYYSANLMTLAVLGRENLDELETLVRTTFSAIPNHQVRIDEIVEPLYASDKLPVEVFIRPQASSRELSLSFPMPDYRDRYRSKPLVYLSNLVGHEGEGSLLSLLKAEGWAESLGAGEGIAYRGGSAFSITINLTEAGLREREQVLRKVFEYLRMLQIEGPQRELFREQARISALQFRFREDSQPMGYVMGLSSDMHYLAPRDVLQGNFLMDDYDPALIREILNRYLTPDNVAITVVAPGVPVDRESEFYATPYSVRYPAPGEAAWQQVADSAVDPRLHLPAPNEFIADKVDLVPLREDNPAVPALLIEQPRMHVWFRQDDQFRIPKGALYASFNSARVADTPADAAAAQLYVRLLQDAVNEYTYPALLAGLNFSIYTHSRGISIRVSGYDDKQRVLLQRIVQSIDKLEVDPRRFENIRADMVRELENVKTGRAFQQAAGDARELLLSGRWNEDALIAELQALDPDAVLRFAEGFWPSTEVDLMLNGNYLPADVEWVTRALQPLLPRDGELAPASVAVTRLNSGDNFVYRAPIEHDDAVVFWYLQGPGDDVQNRALAALTGQIIGTRFFEDLRTEQQLGYVVGAFYWPQLDVPGVAMMVQSPEASVPEVIAAAEQFLAGVAEDESVSPEQFQRHQQALLQDILQPHKNLWEQSEYFWQEIAQDRFDFDSRQRMAEQVSTATLAQWRDWYRQVMLDERASLLVAAPGKSGAMPPGTAVEDPVVFRNQRPVYRSERPTYRNPGS